MLSPPLDLVQDDKCHWGNCTTIAATVVNIREGQKIFPVPGDQILCYANLFIVKEAGELCFFHNVQNN